MSSSKYTPAGKKLVNSPDSCVEEMLAGIAATFPGLSVCQSSRIVMQYEPSKDTNCVGIVSGGGSGHEPYCAGFVGRGMLNAAVAGTVFASPPVSNCFTAIQNLSEHFKGGVLVLILNYTGDIINFGQAIEMARDQGINVESVIVGDDCALIGAEQRIIGRRGLAGMLFVMKIAGALSISGHSLNYIAQLCREVSEKIATLGICLSPCTVPGSDSPLFSLADHQMELGVGIHGEAGVLKINVCHCHEVVDIIIRKIITTLALISGDELCAIVNNLGGTSQIESYVVANELHKQLVRRGMVVKRMYVGTLMTSLDMSGVQITVLKITDKTDWLKLLDTETEAFAWPGCNFSFGEDIIDIKKAEPEKIETGPELNIKEAELMKACLKEIATSLISVEQKLNNLDSGCGDGDCGTTMKYFAEGNLLPSCITKYGKTINQNLGNLPINRPVSCLLELADIASQSMGGTTGGLYSLMLRGAARHAPDWKMAWKSALETTKKYTPAKPGHRTMMDALMPAFDEFEKVFVSSGNWLVALESAVKEAERGCESTRNMKAWLGRASYVDETYWQDVDAGAYAVTVWLNALHTALTEQ